MAAALKRWPEAVLRPLNLRPYQAAVPDIASDVAAALALARAGALGDAPGADAELAAGCAVCAHPGDSSADPALKTRDAATKVRICMHFP
jgi:hypothetical protein